VVVSTVRLLVKVGAVADEDDVGVAVGVEADAEARGTASSQFGLAAVSES
jgi:hypothetical protein